MIAERKLVVQAVQGSLLYRQSCTGSASVGPFSRCMHPCDRTRVRVRRAGVGRSGVPVLAVLMVYSACCYAV